MKRSLISAAAESAGAVIGFGIKRFRWKPQLSAGDIAMRRLTAGLIIPVWLGAGFADYLWHRRTRIETTSGIKESLSHSAMMVEAGPAVLAGLFLEINSGVIAGMLGLAMLHELTVLWDLWFTSPRRAVPAGEQVTHTFLESPPLLVPAIAAATHWGQTLALFGRGRERASFTIRLQRPHIPLWGVALVFGSMGVFGALPHLDELRRCLQARKAGLAGLDTPACLAEVYSRSS